MSWAAPIPPSDEHIWQSFPILAESRRWSLNQFDRLNHYLEDLADEAPGVRTIAFVGSLGRLEAGPHSDLDAIVVLDDEAPLHGESASAAMNAVHDRLAKLGLRCARTGGIFGTPTSRKQLCDGPRGVVDEAVDVFGKRINLLLEGRAVFKLEECRQLQRQILARYAEHPFATRSGETWSYLTDDLVRYWRSYRVWRTWDTASHSGGWSLRNIKLRHSRLLPYAALLLTLVGSEPELSVDELLDLLHLTPLERLRHMDRQLSANAFAEIALPYERFSQFAREQASLLSEPGSQPALSETSPEFAELLENADQLRNGLVRLVTALPQPALDRVLAAVMF